MSSLGSTREGAARSRLFTIALLLWGAAWLNVQGRSESPPGGFRVEFSHHDLLRNLPARPNQAIQLGGRIQHTLVCSFAEVVETAPEGKKVTNLRFHMLILQGKQEPLWLLATTCSLLDSLRLPERQVVLLKGLRGVYPILGVREVHISTVECEKPLAAPDFLANEVERLLLPEDAKWNTSNWRSLEFGMRKLALRYLNRFR